VETPAVAPGPAAEPDGQGQDDRQRLLDEMAAIRRQIAENEARLHTVQAPPPDTEVAAGVPAPESAARAVATAEADAAAAGAAPTQEGEAYYIYGLLPAGVSLPTEGEAIAGIDPAFPVTALTCREIQAAVSRVPLREFGEEELAARFEDLVWVEEKVRRHQEVLEALMRHGPLVPLRFCTLYHSPERVQTLLSDNHARWAHILNTLRGKQEWGVKVFSPERPSIRQVGEVSPKVQKLRAQIAQRSSGAAYFVKKQLEDAIAEEVERLSDQYAQDSHDRLAGCAVQACLNSLQNADAAEDEVKMLVNGAYLVDEAQWTAFRAELSALEAQYGPLG
jgi:hypothetical protein